MKRTSIKITLVLISLICCFCVFADGVKEVKNVPLKQYLEKLQSYQDDCKKYSSQIEMAYDMGDIDAYYKARKSLKDLEAPVLSKAECDAIVEDIVKNNDLKSAELLFQYSNNYRPTIKLVYDEDGFKYNSSICVCPGTDVVLPDLNYYGSSMILKGWGYEKGNVDFKAGDTIKMPVADTTLYAVFEKDPDLVEGKSIQIGKLSVNKEEKLNVPSGKLFDFSFELINDGTDVLYNIEVVFDSDDPLLVVLNNSAQTRYLGSKSSRIATFQAITKAKPGTVLKGEITVKDSDNTIWTKDVTFTVD